MGDLNTDGKNTNAALKNIRLEDLSETLYVLVEGSAKFVINVQAPHTLGKCVTAVGSGCAPPSSQSDLYLRVSSSCGYPSASLRFRPFLWADGRDVCIHERMRRRRVLEET